jgi:Orange carotenoid protein, N-terminal
MTSTNVNPSRQALLAFQQLDIDDRLAVLASLYKQIANSIPADAANALPTGQAAGLVTQIQKLSSEEQLNALRDILPAERTDQNEVMLDPNPSKAMVELVQGGTTIPTGDYGKMKADAKIAFWDLLAQRLGSSIIGIPSDYRLTEQATTVLNMLQSMNTDELVAFLQKAL